MTKPKYEKWLAPEGLRQIEAWAPTLSDRELSDAMGIACQTLCKWMKKYGDIGDTITRARKDTRAQAVNKQVEAALLNKCLGYTVTLEKTFKVREVTYDEQGKRLKETEKLEKGCDQVHVPADTAAQRFWLTNRMPEEWRNKQDVQTTIASGGVEAYLKQLTEAGKAGEEM
jgi:quinol monooxygenase YgiN